MNIKNKIIIALFVFTTLICSVMVTSARVIYEDINSISIRTNFNFDYESIKESGVPDITFNSDGNEEDNVYIASNAKYTIDSCEWYAQGDNEFEIGGTPKVVVYLVTKDNERQSVSNDYYYRFLSSYSSSTCYIKNGTFVSSTRLSTSNVKIVFALKPIKGTFNAPESAYWENDTGGARWDSSNTCDSGYYDLILYRNSAVAARVDKYYGNSYNFAQYFIKEGDYSFKVRTVGGTDQQLEYGKNSEYTESGSITVDSIIVARIIAGGGVGDISNSGTTNVGWIQINNKWYFYRPDGSQVKNGWIQWQNNWYYLDNNGEMKVGLQAVNNKTYYLSSSGAMVTGWVNLNETFYYFDTTAGDNFGALIVNSWVKYDGKYFYFDENGVMVTGWKQIRDNIGNNAFYYFYPKGTVQGLYGYMATNTTINGFTIGSDGKWIQK